MTGGLSIFLFASLAAVVLCGLYRWRAAAAGWLAHPEARSSHRNPTVSGAGAAVVAAIISTLLLFAPPLPLPGYLLLAGSALLSLLGLVDDLANLGVRLRLAMYGLAAVLTSIWLCDPGVVPAEWAVVCLATLWILAFTNLFNFMDGIDGLAELQALSAALALVVTCSLRGASDWYIAMCWAIAGAFAGFLLFNRPPARLFMGDAGSIPGGYLLASLLVAGWCLEGIPVYAGLILLAVFVADATTTLVFRAWRREALVQAHREHLYQRLALRWKSHARVDALFLAVQWLWLTPLAIGVTLKPASGPALCALAYFPLLFTMAKLRPMQ
ncbi:MAG: hypothetical protein RIC38_10990 [Chromatocurvus sp.]